jgi:hypothetical protein
MYTNLPIKSKPKNSSDRTNQVFEQYNDLPVQLDQQTLVAMQGFLESRGFSKESSELISITILLQSSREKFNPMSVIETLKQLNDNDLSQVVSEILNFNRVKTSVLGSVQRIAPIDNVKRNIIP